MSEEAIHQIPAQEFGVGIKAGQGGTLLVYPDRLVYVQSASALIGMAAGGLVGGLIGRNRAKKKAEEQAAAGGDKVTELPFSSIAAIRRGTQALNRKVLEIHLRDGSSHRYGADYTKWAEPIVAVMGQAGCRLTATDDGYVAADG